MEGFYGDVRHNRLVLLVPKCTLAVGIHCWGFMQSQMVIELVQRLETKNLLCSTIVNIYRCRYDSLIKAEFYMHERFCGDVRHNHLYWCRYAC